jgi:hypothetical protein
MRIHLRSSRQLRLGFVALAVAGLLLPGLRAYAQTPDSGGEPGEDARPEKPDKPAKAAVPAAPAEPVDTTFAEPPVAEAGPYVPFAPPPVPLRIENSSASIQFGILAQPQFEMAGSTDADGMTKSLFLRRSRFMVGGTLFKYFEYFFQVDFPNLFKLDLSDTMATDKNAPGLNIQDFFVTVKALEELIKIDVGFMLPPLSHNTLESAAKLYGNDYFANSFRRNVFNVTDPFISDGESPVGRDAGVQARVLVLNGHINVRAGAFMGHRISLVPVDATGPALIGGSNMFRLAGRLQINLLDAEPGFFYQGTYLGTKKIVSFGGFYDFQQNTSTREQSGKYQSWGGDFLVDLPLGPGVLTAQANVVQWDGGTFLPLPKDRAYMGELGYLIGQIKLSPIVRVESLVAPLVPSDATMPGSPRIADPNNPSEVRYGGGLAFWPFGHNSNLKVFFTHVHRNIGLHDFNVISAQLQLFYF